MSVSSNPDWPVLKSYDQDHLTRIALPLGGIGTGTISLGGRGDLRDWEIQNRPNKGFSPKYTFFTLYAKPDGGEAAICVLEGRHETPHESQNGFRLTDYGLPRFRHCEFHAAYPLGQVGLSDETMPLDVRLEAFNPLIPADADRSGYPVAVLRYVLINKTDTPVSATVCGSLDNFIGASEDEPSPGRKPTIRFQEPSGASKIQGLMMRDENLDPSDTQFGTLALATTAVEGVSHRTAWSRAKYANELLDFWDDLASDGEIEQPPRGPSPRGSLAASVRVPARGQNSVTFILGWHFPNRQTWAPDGQPDDTIGNHYATRFKDAWDAASQAAEALPALEAKTVSFVRDFCESDLPEAAKEAALFNLSTLRSETCFRTPDGKFFGWEGCNDTAGCCAGSCTHVWNYEQATPYLFGKLACSMREVEFLHATQDNGHMHFRIDLPLERESYRGQRVAAVDGQMGCLMKLYRDWQLSGDSEMLRKLWPGAKRALEYCWIENGWDADQDGVMEGCQHTTTDFEYFGPNPVGGVWYLGALRAAQEMAAYLGEDDFAGRCADLYKSGSQWIDANLFNGDYYEQEIRPPKDLDSIAPGLRGRIIDDLQNPEYQIGDGCQSDQLVGQYMAHVCGLGFLLDSQHTRTALRSVMKNNFTENLSAQVQYFRTFALNDEAALMFGSWPKGAPETPNFRFGEIWTGLEYAVATQMIYEGLEEDGLRIIEAIRQRFDGAKRSPFDEAECGHHYARAMASWAAVLALSGFRYSGVERSMEFARLNGQFFWSNGYAWGVCMQTPVPEGVQVELRVDHGQLTLKQFALAGLAPKDFAGEMTISEGQTEAWLM